MVAGLLAGEEVRSGQSGSGMDGAVVGQVKAEVTRRLPPSGDTQT